MSEWWKIWANGLPDTGKTKNQVIGWLWRKFCSLDDGTGYDFRDSGSHLGNVGLASGVGNFREGKS